MPITNFFIILLGGVFLITGTAATHASTINIPADYRTITEAVESAAPGDVIEVKEGTYEENIVISKSLTLRSEKGPDMTVVKAANPVEPVFKVINTEGVRIAGFTATGSVLSGIYLISVNSSEIRDNRTTKNGTGIALHSSNNNILVNNIADANEQTGIYLEESHYNTLNKNSADSNKEKGIFLNSSSHNRIIDNSASLNAWNGITFWSSNNNIVEGNRVLRNTYGIVLSNSSENRLADNPAWTNFYIILPVILIYIGVLLYWIQRKVFRYIYSE